MEEQAAGLPLPPRFRWLKRIAIGIAALLLLLAAFRAWWGWHAERVWQAEVARLRTAGEPLEPADFAEPDIPDRQNAAVLYRQALVAISRDALQLDTLERVITSSDNLAGHERLARRVVARNSGARTLARQARDRPAANWGVFTIGPLGISPTPPTPPNSHLLTLLEVAALRAHADGDDAETVATLRDLLALVRHGRNAPHMCGCLFTTRGSDRACRAVEHVAHDLRIADSADRAEARPAESAANRLAVEALIAELLDTQPLQEGCSHGLRISRAVSLAAVRELVGQRQGRSGSSINLLQGFPGGRHAEALALRPAWKMDGARVLQRETAAAQAARMPNWHDATGVLVPEPQRTKTAFFLSRWPSLITRSDDEATMRGLFESIAQRRMAATALAIRLYVTDHGRRPASLAELVPRYLPAVPEDPFEYPPQPITWSEGVNAIPLARGNGGIGSQPTTGTAGRSPSLLRCEGLGPVRRFYLDGDRPAGPSMPTSRPGSGPEAVEDDAEELDEK